jgi:hypothetical protein
VPKERPGEALLHPRDILAGADGDEFSARRARNSNAANGGNGSNGHDEQDEEEFAAWAHLLDAGVPECSSNTPDRDWIVTSVGHSAILITSATSSPLRHG